MINAFATGGDVLQVLLFSVLFGCAMALLGDVGKPVAQPGRHAVAGAVQDHGHPDPARAAGVLGAIAFRPGATA